MSRALRKLVVMGLALGGIALAGCGGGGGGSQSAAKTTSAAANPADAAARHFLDRYVASDGRVQRLDQGGDTVGEGQAYGMLAAAAIADSKRFDAIWAWTKQNLRRPDGLLAFLWRDGRIQDPTPASDADIDASRALLVAACRFHRPALKQEGLDLARAILGQETAPFQGAPVLVAGPWARKQPVTVNPSYFSPAAFAQLQAASGDGQWGSLAASARSVTSALLQSPNRLPSDWAILKGGKPVASGPPSNPKGAAQFTFDAPRTLVRMAEDPDPAGQRIAAGAWPVFEGQDPSNLPVEHDLTGKPIGGTKHPIVLVAAAGAASAAGQTAARDTLLGAAEALDRQTPTYYGAAWVALGRIMLTTKLLNAC